MKIDLNELSNIVHASPVFVSGDAGPVGVPVTLARTSFLPTDGALVIQSNKKAFVPLQIRMKVTNAGANSTSAHALLAVDHGNRYSAGGLQLLSSKGMLGDRAAARTQIINNGGFGSAANWNLIVDWAIAAGVATYTHGTGTGIMTQFTSVFGTPIKPGSPYDLLYTISAPAGTGLLTTQVSGAVTTANLGRIVSGAQVALAGGRPYVTRVYGGPQQDSGVSLAFSATSNVAASAFSLDNVSLKEGFSDAYAIAGDLTLTAENDVRYFHQAVLKTAAAPVWTNGTSGSDTVVFDFTPGANKSAVGAHIAPTSAPIVFAVPPIVVPPGGSLVMHIWHPANSATAPAFQFDAAWAEIGVSGLAA